MSYLVLARKWRPKNFEEVIGQGHVTTTLRNALLSGRLAHAFLFSGPRGVGKTSVARIVAKAINCHAPENERPCNACPACEEINRGASVDVVEIDGASNRGIDEIRQLRENILFRPTSLSSKVYIIDEVHMLTKEAFNALLKTLEEPPGHVYFIFATTEPSKIPATIKSRCQHYEFKRVQYGVLAAHLDTILVQEGIALEEGVTAMIAREAEGSVRDSLSLLDQVIAYGATSVEEVCRILGVSGPAQVEELATALVERNPAKALEIMDRIYQSGADMVKLVLDLAHRFRALALVKALGPAKAAALAGLEQEEAEAIHSRIAGIPLNHLLLVMNELLSSHSLLSRTEAPRIYVEMVLMKICAVGEVVGIDEVIAALEEGGEAEALRPSAARLEQRVQASGNRAETSATHQEQLDQSHPFGQQEKDWQGFLEFVEGKRPQLSSLLEKCAPDLDLSSGTCTISSENGFFLKMLKEEGNVTALSSLAAEFFGQNLRFSFRRISAEVDTAEAPDKKGAKEDDRKNVNAELADLPLVQEAMRVFGANIREIKAAVYRKE